MDRRTALRTLAAATALPVLRPMELAGLRHIRRTLGCDPAPARPFAPQTLSARQLDLVGKIADAILPRTDTPGATDVAVHEFVDLMLTEWYDPPEVAAFVSGLERFDASAAQVHGSTFLGCTPAQQVGLVEALDERVIWSDEPDADADDMVDGFYRSMKRLTITGYFTSEEGAAQTGFRTIPGTFDGCLVPEPAP